MPKILLVLLIALGFGALANAAWLIEIIYFKGWWGLEWLGGYPFSALFIIFLMTLGFLIGFSLRRRVEIIKLFGAGCILLVITFLSFEMMRSFLFTIHSKFGLLGFDPVGAVVILLLPALAWAMIAFFYFQIPNRMFCRLKWSSMILPILATAIAPFLGNLTIWILPNFAYDDSFIGTTKMGYPMFWIVFLFVLCGYIMPWFKKAEV